MKKRVFAVILGSVMAVSLMACGTKENETKDGTKTYTVGISQFAEHASLDNCREGFIEGLKEAGFEEGKNLTIKEENAAADQGTAKQISDGFGFRRCGSDLWNRHSKRAGGIQFSNEYRDSGNLYSSDRSKSSKACK